MRSKLDQSSENEDASRDVIKRYCRTVHWKYRQMDWDNDIDGEIEIFDEQRETTAKFIKVQLKTVDDPKKFENIDSYSFETDVKFLNFCDVCDIPVILAVFNIKEEIGYFVFVQRYIYEYLDVNNSNWRKNLTTVRVKVPLSNSFSLKNAKDKLLEMAFTGFNTIKQLRKTETYKKYYTVEEQYDNSHGLALRNSMKISVEKSFATSKEAMRVIIPKIHNHFMANPYHRNQSLTQKFADKLCDILYLFFYNHSTQVIQGLPFCRTVWVNKKLLEDAKPDIEKPDEELHEDIKVYWNEVEVFEDLFVESMLDKGTYLPKIDEIFSQLDYLYKEVQKLFTDFEAKVLVTDDYISRLKELLSDTQELCFVFVDLIPPIECNDLNNKISGLANYIDNIRLIVFDKNRSTENVLQCIKMHLGYIEEELPEYKYERKKVN